jgi:hypothetical protein
MNEVVSGFRSVGRVLVAVAVFALYAVVVAFEWLRDAWRGVRGDPAIRVGYGEGGTLFLGDLETRARLRGAADPVWKARWAAQRPDRGSP